MHLVRQQVVCWVLCHYYEVSRRYYDDLFLPSPRTRDAEPSSDVLIRNGALWLPFMATNSLGARTQILRVVRKVPDKRQGPRAGLLYMLQGSQRDR